MNSFPKVMITIGLVCIGIGLISFLVGRIFPLGKLPGDIVIKRENVTFYFPIVTSIIISILLSLLFMIFGRFR